MASLYTYGAFSSANRETRIMRLANYLNHALNEVDIKNLKPGFYRYSSSDALKSAQIYSFKTMISYLNALKTSHNDYLNATGQAILPIALREAKFIAKANAKAKRKIK